MLVKICKKAIWVLLVFMVLFQCIAIYGIMNGNAAEQYDCRPLAVATVLMTLAVILFRVLPRGKVIPFAVAAVMGVFFVILAVQMLSVFKVHELVDGSSMGLTFFSALYRHMLPLLIPICMIPVFLDYREKRLEQKAAEEETPPDSYFELLGEVAESEKVVARPKRSIRRRMEKEEDNRE